MIPNYTHTLILEGITGSGKSTHLPEIVSFIESQGKTVTIANSDSPVYSASQSYREVLNGAKNPIVPHTLVHASTNWLKLFAEPQKDDDVLLIDRFVLTDLVYLQARAKVSDIPIDVQLARTHIFQPYGVPNALNGTNTLFFDIEPAEAERRTLNRVVSDCSGKTRNSFDLEIQSLAAGFYQEELGLIEDKHIIDSMQPVEEVKANIRNVLEQLLE